LIEKPEKESRQGARKRDNCKMVGDSVTHVEQTAHLPRTQVCENGQQKVCMLDQSRRKDLRAEDKVVKLMCERIKKVQKTPPVSGGRAESSPSMPTQKGGKGTIRNRNTANTKKGLGRVCHRRERIKDWDWKHKMNSQKVDDCVSTPPRPGGKIRSRVKQDAVAEVVKNLIFGGMWQKVHEREGLRES